MKKSLLALAVLGAFAGAASAQTNVTVYGVVDAGVQYTKFKAEGESESLTEMVSGRRAGSRIGFKGTEDLGGGLSAIFTLENGFSTDTGALGTANTIFNRQAFVGVTGGFGAVKLGRQYTPIHLALDSIDPFNTNLSGDISQTFNNGGIRMNNTINYSLPAIGGLFGEVAYGFGEAVGDQSPNRQIGASVGYANGPVRAVVAYHTANNATASAKDRTLMVGGTFDFAVAKVHAAVANNKGFLSAIAPVVGIASQFLTADEITAERAALNTEFGAEANGVKTRDYMLGVSAPVGAGKVLASFQRKDFRNVADDLEIDVLAVGYVHDLSKRTSLYTSASRMTVDFGGEDDKRNQFNVGVNHKF